MVVVVRVHFDGRMVMVVVVKGRGRVGRSEKLCQLPRRSRMLGDVRDVDLWTTLTLLQAGQGQRRGIDNRVRKGIGRRTRGRLLALVGWRDRLD